MYKELDGFLIDIASVDPHERLQLMLMEIMAIFDQVAFKEYKIMPPPSPPLATNDTTNTMAESVSYVDSGFAPNNEQIATFVHPNDVITPVQEMIDLERWTMTNNELNKCVDDLQKVALQRANLHEIQSKALHESTLDGERPTYDSLRNEKSNNFINT